MPVENQPTFQKNMQLPYSGWKNKPRMKHVKSVATYLTTKDLDNTFIDFLRFYL
jgi:hypothetical protein